jgi:hypothetical protein
VRLSSGFDGSFAARAAPYFGPFVVLLGEDGPDQVDCGGAVGKIPTTSAWRRISLFGRTWG